MNRNTKFAIFVGIIVIIICFVVFKHETNKLNECKTWTITSDSKLVCFEEDLVLLYSN